MGEEYQTSKPQEGTWDNMSTNAEDRKPRVEFPMGKDKEGKPLFVDLTFQIDKPMERRNKDKTGVFYVFPVIHDGIEKEITTSAWSLLFGLKENMPLKDKTLRITKTTKEGKQNYQVEVIKIKEEKIGA